MEKKESIIHPLTWIVIGIAIIVIIIGVLSFSEPQNNQTPTDTSSQTPQTETQPSSTTPTQTPPVVNQTQSLRSKCNTTAKNYFDTYKPTQSTGFETVNLSYQNYYSQSNNSCYVLISYNFNLKDNSDGSSSLKITYTLVDVSRKDPNGNYPGIGSYSQSISAVDKINNRLDSCNVAGADCGSLSGFMSLVNPYLGK